MERRFGALTQAGSLFALAAVAFFSFAMEAESRAAERWKQQWESTMAGAKREAQLMIYGGLEVTHPEILAAFNAEFPFVRVTTVSGRAAELAQRIVAERRAGKFLVDLIGTGPNGPRHLYLAKLLDPISPELILPEVADLSRWYGGKHWYADPENRYIFMYEGTVSSTGISYNTKHVSGEQIRSYWDLVKSEWKGKLLSMDPRGSAVPTPVLVLYYKPGLGAEFLQRIYTAMDITLFRDRRQGTNWLAVGKFALCLFCRDIDRAKQQGLPVDDIPPERLKEAPSIGGGNSSVLALINRAPHPNAARLFLNWFLSRQGQMVWQKVMNTKEAEPSDSMRVDIPKDDVLPSGRRAEGRSYHVIGFLDPEPVQKFLREVLK